MNKITFTVNAIFLKKLLSQQQIKQWWLAEQLGVHRLTLIRWCNSQTKISQENLEKLARFLKCPPSKLIQSDSKSSSCQSLQNPLLKLCQKNYKYDLYENLIKVEMDNTNNPELLIRCHISLIMAKTAQLQYAEGNNFAAAALKIAQNLGNNSLIQELYYQRGINEYFAAKLNHALHSFEKGEKIQSGEICDRIKIMKATTLTMLKREKVANKIFHQLLSQPLPNQILKSLHYYMAQNYLQLEKIELATFAAQKALELSIELKEQIWTMKAYMLLGECHCLTGNIKKATWCLQKGNRIVEILELKPTAPFFLKSSIAYKKGNVPKARNILIRLSQRDNISELAKKVVNERLKTIMNGVT